MLGESKQLPVAGLAESLSRREHEALEMASRGFTNSQIAAQMNVTIHAVKWHLASIYRKLGVSNRTEAAIAYLQSSDANTLIRRAN